MLCGEVKLILIECGMNHWYYGKLAVITHTTANDMQVLKANNILFTLRCNLMGIGQSHGQMKNSQDQNNRELVVH